jgi:CBS-domain-containing membrane protein
MRERQPRRSPPTARELMRVAEVLIPLRMSVGAAGGLLEAVGAGVAPVVDYRGRCVGVFTATDYQRWVDRAASEAEPILERSPASGVSSADEVRYHITGQFAPVALDAPVPELLHRLDGGTDPFLIVIDRQARPRGIVCALDVLVADSECTRAGTALALAELETGEWRGANRYSTSGRSAQFRATEPRQPER